MGDFCSIARSVELITTCTCTSGATGPVNPSLWFQASLQRLISWASQHHLRNSAPKSTNSVSLCLPRKKLNRDQILRKWKQSALFRVNKHIDSEASHVFYTTNMFITSHMRYGSRRNLTFTALKASFPKYQPHTSHESPRSQSHFTHERNWWTKTDTMTGHSVMHPKETTTVTDTENIANKQRS